jgi:hypothetical protein
MGILLVTILICTAIGLIVGVFQFCTSTAWIKHTKNIMIVWAIILSIVYGLVAFMSIGFSYDSYVNARAFQDSLVDQYKGAITMYEDKSISIDVKRAALDAYVITDLKYKGYQDNMADFIKDLRNQIVEYNKCVITKRLMKKNFFYNWYIIPPDDDMKPISILD